jgi:TolB-like protein/DNA-binding winged helix-turn-helix (wHTH) protein
MEPPTATTKLRIGDWCANPASGEISRNGEIARVEVRTMRLLLCLAEHAGEVVSIDDLLNQVWPDVVVAPDSVYQAVTSLRRLLGDDPKRPTYIATVPRLGYRMVAMVGPWTDQSMAQKGAGTKVEAGSSRAPNGELANSAILTTPTTSALDVPEKSGPRLRSGSTLAAVTAVCLALVVALLFYGKLAKNNHSASSDNGTSGAIASQPQKSVAVLPFLDLTDEMNQEPFADGMTEELIDKLSKIPGLRVPSATSSFYFKSKLWPRSHGTPQITIAEIAKTLGVAFVLDGSVRKSGSRLRVDARLIRADNGFVVWSETYDRPSDDILIVQDDIAGEVAKALRASIEGKPE